MIVTGIVRGSTKLLKPYIYDESERPIVAQMFGNIPSDFYTVSILLCSLGFDGIDINMGCPSKSVSGHGSGAALIQTPKLAQEIILSCKKGVSDWVNGIEITSLPLPKKIIDHVLDRKKDHSSTRRTDIPVSVKTRLGYDTSVIQSWIPQLLEAEPELITLHGRTLKQMYKGTADWSEISKAAEIIHKTKTFILGNGDINNKQEAESRIKEYHVDGALIGRATLGNPYVFLKESHNFTKEERLQISLDHAEYFVKIKGENWLFEMRKYWNAYIRGFDGAKEIRTKLMSVTSLDQAKYYLEHGI